MTTVVLLLLLLAVALYLTFRLLRAQQDHQSRRWRIVVTGLALALVLGLVLWLAVMVMVVGPELRGG
jgi:dolichyl-phosphate-mannose--protein O-mannosyl transferase